MLGNQVRSPQRASGEKNKKNIWVREGYFAISKDLILSGEGEIGLYTNIKGKSALGKGENVANREGGRTN